MSEGLKASDLSIGAKRPQQASVVVRPPFDRLPRAQAGVLFGRDAQLSDLVTRLRRGEDVCIWGPAGFGKTALAAEALLHVVGTSETTLVSSPFPDGVVVLDIYRCRADSDRLWHQLADRFAPYIPAELPAYERARRACAGRRALIIVEGAEEAGNGGKLQNLLAVLDGTAVRLVLTRNKAQVFHAYPIEIDAELMADDAIALLRELTENQVDGGVLNGVVEILGGHPLALTWAGCQLARAEEKPWRFLTDLRQSHLPGLHEPGYEGHTVKWLYDRSIRQLGHGARQVLAAGGLLASAPFPLGAAVAAIHGERPSTLAELEDQARDALRQLVRHGLLRFAVGDEERWEFTHALAARFAMVRSEAIHPHLASLCQWAHEALRESSTQMCDPGGISRLQNAILHATALLALDATMDTGTGIANWLLYDGQDLFFASGRLSLARDALAVVEGWMQRAPEAKRVDTSWRRELAGLFSRKGDVQLAQGDLTAARESYQSSQRIAEELAASDPTNAQWQRDLSISLNKLGDAQLAQGDPAAARESYQSSRQIREKLTATDPTNVQWQRDLSVSFEKLGDVQLAQRDLTAARQSYQSSLQIAEKLIAADPTNTQWQRDLSISLDKLGDVQLAQGDLDAARHSYQYSHQIAERLAVDDPTNTEWQRDLSASLNRLGNFQLAQGDLDAAWDSYQSTRHIAEKLAGGDPTNAEWQRDLAASHCFVGIVEQAKGDLLAALVSYRAYRDIMEKVAAGDPTNVEWQRDLSASLNKLGDVQLAQGDLAGARDSYQEDLKIAEKLAAGDPANTEWQRDLVIAHGELGVVAARAGDKHTARREFEAGLTIVVRLCRLDPTNATWRDNAEWLREQIKGLRSPG